MYPMNHCSRELTNIRFCPEIKIRPCREIIDHRLPIFMIYLDHINLLWLLQEQFRTPEVVLVSISSIWDVSTQTSIKCRTEWLRVMQDWDRLSSPCWMVSNRLVFWTFKHFSVQTEAVTYNFSWDKPINLFETISVCLLHLNMKWIKWKKVPNISKIPFCTNHHFSPGSIQRQ